LGLRSSSSAEGGIGGRVSPTRRSSKKGSEVEKTGVLALCEEVANCGKRLTQAPSNPL